MENAFIYNTEAEVPIPPISAAHVMPVGGQNIQRHADAIVAQNYMTQKTQADAIVATMAPAPGYHPPILLA